MVTTDDWKPRKRTNWYMDYDTGKGVQRELHHSCDPFLAGCQPMLSYYPYSELPHRPMPVSPMWCHRCEVSWFYADKGEACPSCGKKAGDL